MKVGVVTLFPEIFSALDYGIPRIAQEKKSIELYFWNPRDFTTDKHRTIDDTPYGGGPGMVMKIEPLYNAIQAAKEVLPKAKVIYLSPQGQTFNHQVAVNYSAVDELILLCGRYEGIDERLIELVVDNEISIGDYVLSGGEIPALTIIDAISRLLPDVLGDEQSAEQDSFANGLLDYPQYTRPIEFLDLKVPSVLTSGHHEQIANWRQQQSMQRTCKKRPDLVKSRSPTIVGRDKETK